MIIVSFLTVRSKWQSCVKLLLLFRNHHSCKNICPATFFISYLTPSSFSAHQVRRRMDQAEGGRDALIEQIEDYRKQLFLSEQDRLKLQLLLDDKDKELSDNKQKYTGTSIFTLLFC